MEGHDHATQPPVINVTRPGSVAASSSLPAWFAAKPATVARNDVRQAPDCIRDDEQWESDWGVAPHHTHQSVQRVALAEGPSEAHGDVPETPMTSPGTASGSMQQAVKDRPALDRRPHDQVSDEDPDPQVKGNGATTPAGVSC